MTPEPVITTHEFLSSQNSSMVQAMHIRHDGQRDRIAELRNTVKWLATFIIVVGLVLGFSVLAGLRDLRIQLDDVGTHLLRTQLDAVSEDSR